MKTVSYSIVFFTPGKKNAEKPYLFYRGDPERVSSVSMSALPL
jgi:hypothetical protein